MIWLYLFIGFIVAFSDVVLHQDKYKEMYELNRFAPHFEFFSIMIAWLPLLFWKCYDFFIKLLIKG